nr:immunoglobulin light chain junction region [Macaca mulatta]
CLKYSSSPFTF